MITSSATSKASIYTDFEGLSDLRREARDQAPGALEEAARQFEALFLQKMLKEMREASGGGGLFENDQSKMFQGMHDKQLALSMVDSGKGIGLAEQMVNQLQGLVGQSAEAAGAGGAGGGPVPERQPFPVRSRPAADAPEAGGAAEARPDRGQAADAAAAAGSEPARFESPEAFVRHLWPHAEKAAKELGTDPRALLAQAALETGWGKAVIRRSDGSSSHNLFNIKADARWEGEAVGTSTLEYRDGVVERERAEFRSYGSYAESFQDYVDFLRDNPRYREALDQAGDPDRFVRSLHEAGYATDPAYADKIEDIMGRSELVSASLKKPGDRTLS